MTTGNRVHLAPALTAKQPFDQYNATLCSIYDELYKLNVSQDSYEIIYFVENKHVTPAHIGKISEGIVDVADNMIHPSDKNRFLTFFNLQSIRKRIYEGKKTFIGEFRKLWVDGSYHWASLTLVPFSDDSGDENLLCYVMDIEDKKRIEFDSLTGILNEESFYFHAGQLLQDNPNLNYAIIRVDIDRFKFINEIYGLTEGDRLLCLLAHTLQEHIGQNEVCGRINNDIFCFLKTYQDDTDALIDTINNICSDLEAKTKLYKPILSFGIYLVDDLHAPINILCDRANLALRTVKGTWAKLWAFYDSSLRAKQFEERMIETEMENALAQDQFCIYLQPKHSLQDRSIIGAEALVRWIHPEKGFLSPASFIPLFERNGFIVKLDEYVWRETFKLLSKWQSKGYKPLPISINVSRMHIYNPNFVEKILSMIDEYKINPNLVELELTESAFIENTMVLYNNLAALQKSGISFSMDDFGSGYSSLNMLKDAPIDTIKLDRGFLTKSAATKKGAIIIQNTILLAKRLELQVIAEGVETQEQMNFLAQAGCAAAQGFFFSRPMPIEEFEQLAFSDTEAQQPTHNQALLSDLELLTGLLPDLLPSVEDQLIRRILDAIPIGIVGFYPDQDFPIYFINKYLLRKLGYHSCEELLTSEGNSILNYVYKDDQANVIQAITSMKNEEYSVQYRMLKKRGSYIWVSGSGHKLKQANKDIVLTALCDITELVRMHRKVERYSQRILEKSNELEDFYNTAVSGIGKFAINTDTKEVELFYVNNQACQMTGYTKEELLFIDKPAITLVHEEDYPIVAKILFEALSKNEHLISCRYRLKRKDGSYFWVQMDGRITDKRHNGYPILYCMYTDIDKQREQELESRKQQYLVSLVSSTISGGTLVAYDDDNYTLAYISEHLLNFLDYSYDEFFAVTKGSFYGVIHPDDRLRVSHDACKTLQVNEYYEDEFRLLKKDGSAIWVVEKGSIALDKDGRRIFVCLIVDNTKQKLQQQQLMHHARIDLLTGILNRNAAETAIKDFLAHPFEDLSALLVLDLDNFKQINDLCGHRTGDETLAEVGKILSKHFNNNAIIGRWGGDEFFILVPNTDFPHIRRKAQSLCQEIGTLFTADTSCSITCSIGIALFSYGADFHILYSLADTALYEAKGSGKNTFRVRTL